MSRSQFQQLERRTSLVNKSDNFFTLAHRQQKVGIALLKCKKTSSLQYNVHFPQSIICCFPKKIRGGSVPIDLRISVMIYPIHKREMVRQCTTSLNDQLVTIRQCSNLIMEGISSQCDHLSTAMHCNVSHLKAYLSIQSPSETLRL